MAVYENGKIIPGTERKRRSKNKVAKIRRARAVWKKGRKAAIVKNGAARF